MRVKEGADLNGVHFLLWYAAAVYDWMRLKRGLGPGTITSGRDGDSARSPDSLHPLGLALDLRTSDLSDDDAAALERDLAVKLGGQFYLEHQTGNEGRHLHVQLHRAIVTAAIEQQASSG